MKLKIMTTKNILEKFYPNLYNQQKKKKKELKSDIEILELISKNISKIKMDLKEILE